MINIRDFIEVPVILILETTVIEFVQITVNNLNIYIEKLIFGKVIGCFQYACRIAKSGYNQPAEHSSGILPIRFRQTVFPTTAQSPAWTPPSILNRESNTATIKRAEVLGLAGIIRGSAFVLYPLFKVPGILSSISLMARLK